MQISKENVTSGFKIAANLLKSVFWCLFIFFHRNSGILSTSWCLYVSNRFDSCKYKEPCKKGLTDNICSKRHSYTFYIRIFIVFDKRLRQLLKGSILVSSCRFLFLFANNKQFKYWKHSEFDPIHVHPDILLFFMLH